MKVRQRITCQNIFIVNRERLQTGDFWISVENRRHSERLPVLPDANDIVPDLDSATIREIKCIVLDLATTKISVTGHYKNGAGPLWARSISE